MVAGFLVVLVIYLRVPLTLTWLHVAVAQGLVAAFLNRRLAQPWWWQWIHLGFSPLAVSLMAMHVSSWAYMAVFLGLLLIYWSTFRTRVPFFLTNRTTLNVLVEILTRYQPQTVVDLGCATGGLLKYLAMHFPDIRFDGFEVAPLPVCIAKWRLRDFPSVNVTFGDFWQADFSQYDVVYAFLSDEPMSQLWDKACQEMHEGALLVSNTFTVPDAVPDEVVHVADFRGTELLIWRMSGIKRAKTFD